MCLRALYLGGLGIDVTHGEEPLDDVLLSVCLWVGQGSQHGGGVARFVLLNQINHTGI